MTIQYRYLGYGTTDSNGIATLDHDANGDTISHSYTGTGAGEVVLNITLQNIRFKHLIFFSLLVI